MKFAILIPVFNHLDYTKSTLNELSAHISRISGGYFQLVLIDDGSTDGTARWVKENHPEVVILRGDGNLWWSGATNMGAQHAIEQLGSDYLILWNNDILIDDHYFREVIRITSETGDSTVIGSKICVAEDRGVIWSMGGYFNSRSGKCDMYGYFENDGEEYQRVRDVDWITGMGTIVPRKVVETIGYWDHIRFPQYHGDSDFTYRAKLAGFKLRIYPQLKLYNHVDNSGIEHSGNLKSLFRLFTDIRSKSNIKKKLLFTRLYATSPKAYLSVIYFYFKIVAGFIKWKFLNLFGIRK